MLLKNSTKTLEKYAAVYNLKKHLLMWIYKVEVREEQLYYMQCEDEKNDEFLLYWEA